LIVDPKLSCAERLTGLFRYVGFDDDLIVLNENEQTTINPLLSGLSGAKLAEMIVRARHAGKPMTVSSGSAHYESLEQDLLGNLITVSMTTRRPCLRQVGEMLDALSQDRPLSAPDPGAAEALQRIHIFMQAEEKERRQVLTGILKHLAPYREKPWRNIFWEPGPFTLDTIRDEGKIIVAAFSPNKVNHLSSGLFLLKTLFYSVIMDRMTTGFVGNKTRLCLLLIDEFHQVVSGGGDADFLSVRREARCCPVFACQQIGQLETVIPNEWKNVLGLLSTKIFLRQDDIDTALYAERLSGFVEESVDAVTRAPDAWRLFYQESSRTTTRQLQPRVPAEYFRSLPDGDAIIIGDQVEMAWFPAAGMSKAEEIQWRKKKWPHRPRLLDPRNFRH